MNNSKVAVYLGDGEVLLLPTDIMGNVLNESAYFASVGRSVDDYEKHFVDLPARVYCAVGVDSGE